MESNFVGQKKLFVGVEAEGPLAGKQTLFVQGEVPIERIRKALIAEPDVSHVYFGAGRLSPYDLDSVHLLLKSDDTNEESMFLVTLETTDELAGSWFYHPNFRQMLPVCMSPDIKNTKNFSFKGINTLDTYKEVLDASTLKSQVMLKCDSGGDKVLVVHDGQTYINSYADYNGDRVIWSD